MIRTFLFILICASTLTYSFISLRNNKEKQEVMNKTFVYCAPSFDTSQMNKSNAPLLDGLGKFNYKVSTNSPKAQQYFSQGLALTYGFNHGEAARSFNTALKHDSTFAMAYWGLAMVLGPNYNAALNPTSLADINNAIDNAVKYSSAVTAKEKALINAMTKRFPRAEVSDMTPYYEAYASEMKLAHQQFPDDIDIATICADALMNLHPWNLWLKDGTAQPWTGEIMGLLEGALAKAPAHPGAMHYYIHAIEASKQADKATVYADRLINAMPAAGHMVHMPSHIYIRTGEYHKGVLVNESASKADSSYIAQCKVQGAVPMMYYPHNIHFLAACAFLEGNTKKAIKAAWSVSGKADKKSLAENASSQHFYIIPYYTLTHLGKWNDILQIPQPGESLLYPLAIWHYARGMAQAAKGDMQAAEQSLAAVKKIAADSSLKKLLIWDMNSASELVNIASNTLEGELLGYKKQYKAAAEFFHKAIAIEDNLMYTEPPDWFFSVRHSLGHWLNKAGEFDEAEKVYKEDLELFRENGWALIGLYNSLIGQEKKTEAATVKKRFDKAWQYADVKISTSRIF